MSEERLGTRLAQRHQELLGENENLRARNAELLAALKTTYAWMLQNIILGPDTELQALLAQARAAIEKGAGA